MKYTIVELNDLIGKTIAIFPSDKICGGYGEVKSVSQNGILKGTWGNVEIIPGVDRFEVAGMPASYRDKYILI